MHYYYYYYFLLLFLELLTIPGIVYFSHIGQNQILFNWKPVTNLTYCPSLEIQYNIISSCGNCPRHTNSTNVTCSEIAIDRSRCSFYVYASAMCGSIIAGQTSSVSLMLNGCQNTAYCKV